MSHFARWYLDYRKRREAERNQPSEADRWFARSVHSSGWVGRTLRFHSPCRSLLSSMEDGELRLVWSAEWNNPFARYVNSVILGKARNLGMDACGNTNHPCVCRMFNEKLERARTHSATAAEREKCRVMRRYEQERTRSERSAAPCRAVSE